MANAPERKRGAQSKIEKYELTQEAITLLKVMPKMSYNEIASELNTIGNVPEEDLITYENVSNFAKSYPGVRSQVMIANKAYLRKTVFEGAEFDMLGQLREMAFNTKFMLDTLQDMAMENGGMPEGKEYKAYHSELRETLKQIESIHKEVYDMDVVREFLIEVIKTLKEVAPEALPAFIAKMKGKRENSHIVNELLSGGMKNE